MPQNERFKHHAAGPDSRQTIPKDLYHAVYRRGAGDADIEALRAALQTVDTNTPDGSLEAAPNRRRLIRRGGLATVAVALLAGILTAASYQQVSGVPTRQSTPSKKGRDTQQAVSTPIPLLGDLENRQRQESALRELFANPSAADLQIYLLDHHFSGAVASLDHSNSVSGTAVGAHTFDLGSIAAITSPTHMTVLITCDRPSKFTWRLVSFGVEHDDPTSIRSTGSECSKSVVAASVHIAGGHAPAHLELGVPKAVRVIITVISQRDG